MREHLQERIKRVSEILSKISIERWNKIVENEPEWKFIQEFKSWGFGKLATLIIAVALNDYQLRGKANEKYFPEIEKFLKKEIGDKVPSSPEELKQVLKKFYEGERSKSAKIKRLERFFESRLAKRIWNSSIEDISKSLCEIRLNLSEVMNNSPNKKTIVFAMKCLGMVLMAYGKQDLEISISIPVDKRIRDFTQKILGGENLDDNGIQEFWDEVLKKVREKVKINMIHLDSLIWQVGEFVKSKRIDENRLRRYFKNLGIEDIGEEIINLLKS